MNIAKTFFMKIFKRKWTRKSPNAEIENAFDLIPTNNSKIKDVNVSNKFQLGCDHKEVQYKTGTTGY